MPYSLAAGPEIVAIPGPTIVPDRVLSATHRPMPDLYGTAIPMRIAFSCLVLRAQEAGASPKKSAAIAGGRTVRTGSRGRMGDGGERPVRRQVGDASRQT